MRQVHQLIHRIGLKHLLLFLNSETENRAQKIRQPRGIIRAQHNEPHFRRDLRQISKRLLDKRLHVALGRLDFFFIPDLQFGRNLHPRPHERFFLHPLLHPNSIRSLNDQMQRVFDALHALDHHQCADFKQIRRLGVFVGSFLRPHTNAANQFLFAGERGFHCRNRGGPSHRQRHHCVRKQSCVLQGQHRNLKRLAFAFLGRHRRFGICSFVSHRISQKRFS